MSPQPTLIGIKTVPIGKQFITFCVVRNSEIKYKQNGEPYLLLELGDQSGRLKARIWEKAEEMYREFKRGEIVKIKGVVQKYKDSREVKILKIRKAVTEDHISLEDLLPRSGKELTAMVERLQYHINSIQNRHLKKLLENLFSDESFANAYYRSPAGKLWHHNYLSGLLEHVILLLDLSEILAVHYPQLNLDILKTGIICHDIGKVKEYSLEGYIDFSDEGRLVGYMAMGYEMISREIERLEQFPGELRKHILHMMVSHSSPTSTGLQIQPMTLEAIALQRLIQLGEDINAFVRIIDSDILPDEKWSKYIPLLERFVCKTVET